MTITQALSRGKEFLRASLDGEVLLASILGTSREYLMIHGDEIVSDEHVATYAELCKKREQGIPLAYLTNYKEFFGLGFYVDQRVLIPRPETEILVEDALGLCQKLENPVLCDVGTGSGCIAISIAAMIPNACLVAVDISKDALDVASRNALTHGVESRVECVQSDLLEKVMHEKFDGIVANLPYIGLHEDHLVAKDVALYEPAAALYGGEKGVELIERLLSQVSNLAPKPKWLIGEMGFLQKQQVAGLIKKYFPTAKVAWKSDLAGLDRFFIVYFA